MSDKPQYRSAEYLKSAHDLAQLPADQGVEVAFIGRSNSGKSSSLNALTGIKSLARVSKTPGRTQAINLFTLNTKQRLVDLPGYGYAKVPRTVQERWESNVEKYLQSRECLRGLILLMDVRHPLKDSDHKLLEWCAEVSLPLHVLLTKSDKLKSNAMRKELKHVRDALQNYGGEISVQLFSSLNGNGLDELRDTLDTWFTED